MRNIPSMLWPFPPIFGQFETPKTKTPIYREPRFTVAWVLAFSKTRGKSGFYCTMYVRILIFLLFIKKLRLQNDIKFFYFWLFLIDDFTVHFSSLEKFHKHFFVLSFLVKILSSTLYGKL